MGSEAGNGVMSLCLQLEVGRGLNFLFRVAAVVLKLTSMIPDGMGHLRSVSAVLREIELFSDTGYGTGL